IAGPIITQPPFFEPDCHDHFQPIFQHNDLCRASLSAQQAPEGIFYSNVWSYYHASGSDFGSIESPKCGPATICTSLKLNVSGSLDEFVDQNIIGWTSPYKVLGANYGLFVDVPFAIADASGAASLEPVLSLNRGSLSLPSLQTSGGVTKGSIGD